MADAGGQPGALQQLAGAGLGSRAYAFMTDWHIRVLVALAWMLVGYALVGADWRIVLVPAGVFYLLYHPVVELVMNGWTPGKQRARIRVVDAGGGVPSRRAALVRNALRVVDSLPLFYGLGIVLALMDPRGRRLGDRVAGTYLVHARPVSPAEEDPAALARELLSRWPELEPARRVALARRLLGALGEGDRTLKQRLERLLQAGGGI